MTVTDNYMLQQMQQMASSMTGMPQTGSTSKEKDSFQDMLDQTASKETVQDAGKAPESAEKPQKEQPAKDAKETPKEAEKAPVQEEKKAAEAGKPQEAQGDPNAMALLLNLYRPQIVDASEPEAAVSVPVEAVAQDGAAVVPEPEAAGLTEALQPEAQAVEAAPEQAPQVREAPQEAPVREEAPEAPEVREAPAQGADREEAPEAVQAPAEQDGRPQVEEAEELPEVRQEAEEAEEPKGEAVEADQQVFHDVKAEPVKVGETYETVDTQKPEMDEKMAATIRQAAEDGAERVEIKLSPANLGTVTIEMTRDPNGALQIVLHATNGRAESLLSQHLDGLHAALASYGQGQEVHVEVQRNQESPEQHMFQQADPDGRGQHQQQRQQRQEEQPESGEDFLQKLRLGLIGLESA